jgi:hypothetical protein
MHEADSSSGIVGIVRTCVVHLCRKVLRIAMGGTQRAVVHWVVVTALVAACLVVLMALAELLSWWPDWLWQWYMWRFWWT